MDKVEQLVVDNERLVYHYMHKHHPAEIGDEDLIQELRISLWKSARTYDENKSKFSTWAYHNLVNAYKHYHRKGMAKKRKLSVPLASLNTQMSESMAVEFIDELVAPDNYILGVSVKDLENRLPEKAYQAFVMYISGYTKLEIADQLNISQAQVSRLLKRSKQVILDNVITIN